MGLRDNLYQDIDKLYQQKIARTHFLKQKSLEAIREGRLPSGLNPRTKDVIRWVLEDREMRLRRKRDLKVLYSEWKIDKEERQVELNNLFNEFAKERQETRANWQEVRAKVARGKEMVGRGTYKIAPKQGIQASAELQPPTSPEADYNQEKPWQIGEEG